MDVTYAIAGMHCGSCLGRIKDALKPYADAVDVSISPQRATLKNVRPGISVAQLQAAVAKAGPYTISSMTGANPGVTAAAREGDAAFDGEVTTYWPLIVIVGYIALASFAGDGGDGESRVAAWMMNFMAGFFLVFSAFKFLDLSGFADAYARYDLLAQRWRGYGYIYPFLELALGVAYLFRLDPFATNIATIAIMGFSSLGVIRALLDERKLQCACLGTALKLPMSTVTFVEDFGMAVMAALMLLY